MSAARTLGRLTSSAVVAGAALAASGCGGGQTTGLFNPGWVNDGGAGIGTFQQRFAANEVPKGADVAIGVIGVDGIVGVPLEGGSAWSFQHALDSRPTVTGNVVIGQGGGELFALSATTGEVLWKRQAGGLLRGAGDDGKTTVISLQSEAGGGSTLLAVDRSGTVVRQVEEDAPIGVPAVVGRYAFVPWKGQYISVFDMTNGNEAARALLRSQTSHAFVRGGQVFFGESAVVRFDDKIRHASQNGATTITLPARELPGKPVWMGPGTDVRDLAPSARDNIRLYARPAQAGGTAVESGRFAATYFRVALGFDAQSGALSWVHAHDSEFVGGTAYAGGFALCDRAGDVTFIDAQTGGVVSKVSMGKAVDTCQVQADGFSATGAKAPSLSEQLAKAVMMPEAEHVMVQKLLLREMAALEDPMVTKVLIDIASNPKTPPMILEDGRKALASRRNGADHMLTALERHYDYLADVLMPPPVGPMAEALAAMKEKRATPLLAKHLNDPADTLDDMEKTAAALAVLADASVKDELATFFALYRGAAEEEVVGNAVVSVAQALMAAGGESIVAAAAEDPNTTPAVKSRIAALVKKPAEGKGAKPAAKAGNTPTKAGKPAAPGKPPAKAGTPAAKAGK